MLKLKGYLKPFIPMLLIAIAFLFVQAMSDLNLPNYMSDIVNVGIQQGGISHGAPEQISQDGFTLMTLLMNQEDGRVVESNYTLTQGDPGNTGEEITYYQLNKVDNSTLEELDDCFGTAVFTLLELSKQMQASSGGEAAESTVDITNIDLDMDAFYQLIPVIQMMPDEALRQAQEAAAAREPSLRSQSGAAMAKVFYEELGIDTDKIQQNYIIKTGIIMLLIALAGGAATVVVGFISARIGAGLSRRLRRDIFAKVEGFSLAEFDKFSTSSLITRTTNDVNNVQMLVIMGIRMIFYSPILGIGGIIMVLRTNSSMTWILGVAVAILLGLILVVYFVAMPKFKIMQRLIDKVNLVARENLNGLMVVRAFGTQDFEENRFDRANTDLTRNNLFVQRVMTVMMPVMMLVMNGISCLIIWVGGHQIADSAMQVGDMMAFIQYGMQVIMSFLSIAMMFIMVPRSVVSANRIAEVLYTDPTITDPEKPKSFSQRQIGYVEFENVSFGYSGAEENVLHNISFVARPGETTAFIGSTGSGKSTLINLIPRLYDVIQGSVKVNGIDVREVSQYDLREQIGYIPQKGSLLSGTIASNLQYGRSDATEQEMDTAAEIAQATEFISTREEGYDSPISESGANVSGGQKQRLSIARALVKNAPVYIFDDSFSALDFKTDAALRKALKNKTGRSTVLIVAQRISTIMDAEQIIVLDEGKVVGKGTHRELLESCPTYYDIAVSQLSKEDLA